MTFLFSGNIKLPSFGNTTCVNKGDDQTISWSFSYDVSQITGRQWTFRQNSSYSFKTLYSITGDGAIDSAPTKPLTNTEVIKPASLVIKKANLDNNGTYQFDIALKFGTHPNPSNVDVIVKGDELVIHSKYDIYYYLLFLPHLKY